MTISNSNNYRGRIKAFWTNWECTTDFVDWENNVDIDDFTDITDLYRSIEQGRRAGKFKIEQPKNNLHILPSDGDVVLILTPKSRDAYLRFLQPVFEICEKKLRGGLDTAQWNKLTLNERRRIFAESRFIDV